MIQQLMVSCINADGGFKNDNPWLETKGLSYLVPLATLTLTVFFSCLEMILNHTSKEELNKQDVEVSHCLSVRKVFMNTSLVSSSLSLSPADC